MAALLSGTKLKDAIESDILPVKIAAMDSFLGNSFPHAKELVFKDSKEGRRMQVLAKKKE